MAVKFLNQEALAQTKPTIPFPKNFNLRQHIREVKSDRGEQIYEFIGTDTFGAEWYARQRFEIEAGRLEVPTVYQPIYNTISDPNLPRVINLYKLGPGGVVLEEIMEGGEVKFAGVTSSEEVVRLRHYGVGLEYSDDLVAYNELWNVPIIEREVGRAYNALLNHMHLYPILSYSYAAANQTAANTSGTTTVEDWMLTIEDAIVASMEDTTNPRPGPYALLIHPAQTFMVERALNRVPQQGFQLDSSAVGMIQTVIGYRGWTGTRGKKTVTYPGVTSGKAYLVNLSFREEDFQSYIKQGLEEYGRDEDITRFLMQIVWDTRFGVYANPLRAVEELTWPS